MSNFIQKVMTKWNIDNYWDFFIINCVFALAGMSIVFIRKPLFHVFGITHSTPFWIKFLTWLAIVFPTYQINLLIFGALFGKFPFFWEKEKKLLRFLFRL